MENILSNISNVKLHNKIPYFFCPPQEPVLLKNLNCIGIFIASIFFLFTLATY